MLAQYKIAETDTFLKQVKKYKADKIYTKVKFFVYPQLENNPHFGHNIKKLKGELQGLYRYRIGNYRLFYKVSDDKNIVFILELKQRKGAY